MKVHRRNKSDPNLLSPEQLLQLYMGMKKLEGQKKSGRWKLAKASGADRRLLIGRSLSFKPPGPGR